MNEKELIEKFRAVMDPDLNRDIVSLGFIKKVEIGEKVVTIDLQLTTPACPVTEEISESVKKIAEKNTGRKAKLNLSYNVPSGATIKKGGVLHVKNIIAIGSGKGGVGKSTVTLQLAFALNGMGAKVGILDADMYNASIPQMLGSGGSPQLDEKKNMIIPPAINGIKVISLGQFVGGSEAVVWRGPLVSKAVKDFIDTVQWGELDYLLVDLPPGTGDAPLTLAQNSSLSGVIIVTTPQWAALSVAIRAAEMFKKLNVGIVGIVENMSYLVCPHCGNRIDLYGGGLVRQKARDMDISYLGEIPLDPQLRINEDTGILLSKKFEVSHEVLEITRNVAARISVLDMTRADKPLYLDLQPK